MKKLFIISVLCCACSIVMAQDKSDAATQEKQAVEAAQDSLKSKERFVYCKYKTATYGQAKAMAFLMAREQFDEPRLKLAKKYIKNYKLTTEQLGWLTETFTYNDFKLKFLKKAEKHCSDIENYTTLVGQYYSQKED